MLEPSVAEAIALAESVRARARAGLIPPALERRLWPVRMHWQTPDGYELAASRSDWLPTMLLCAMLIHNAEIAPAGDEDAILFASDLASDGLYRVDWKTLLDLERATVS